MQFLPGPKKLEFPTTVYPGLPNPTTIEDWLYCTDGRHPSTMARRRPSWRPGRSGSRPCRCTIGGWYTVSWNDWSVTDLLFLFYDGYSIRPRSIDKWFYIPAQEAINGTCTWEARRRALITRYCWRADTVSIGLPHSNLIQHNLLFACQIRILIFLEVDTSIKTEYFPLATGCGIGTSQSLYCLSHVFAQRLIVTLAL